MLEHDQALREMYGSGLSLSQCARVLGWRLERVRQHLLKMGVAMRSRGKPPKGEPPAGLSKAERRRFLNRLSDQRRYQKPANKARREACSRRWREEHPQYVKEAAARVYWKNPALRQALWRQWKASKDQRFFTLSGAAAILSKCLAGSK